MKANGDGCMMSFNQREVKMDIPNTMEKSFSILTNGFFETLELKIIYNDTTGKEGSVSYKENYTNIEMNDVFLKDLKIGGKNYKNLIQFVFEKNSSPDLKKILFAENFGIVQIIYNYGDTLIRK